MDDSPIPFNRPYLSGKELAYIGDALTRGQLSGNGYYTRACHQQLTTLCKTRHAFLTHSCTGAIEMAALIAGIEPGDEVIMPAFTFVSTANPFVLRGGVPVFVDIRSDTLNIDEEELEAAITERTKAITAVHYAGIGCDMRRIMQIAEAGNLLVIEDAAQGIAASYNERPLGSIGHLGALSFHATKNVISGEGGALLVNDDRFSDQAEIIWEKGTNRGQFSRGMVDKYTWMDHGSSFLPGELTAAFLHAQLQQVDFITSERVSIWEKYHAAFESLEKQGRISRPVVPEGCRHNGHLYYLLLPDETARNRMIEELEKLGISGVFHYLPLDQSRAGEKYCRSSGDLKTTHDICGRLLRLPLWVGLDSQQERVIDAVHRILDS